MADQELIPYRVLAHPLRLRLLSLLTGTAMSAAEVARAVGTTQANASYHLRRLHAAGLLELAEEVSVRGGRARRYRHEPTAGAMTDAELWVDEAVWLDVRDRVVAAMLDLHRAARPPHAPGALRTSSTVSLFVMSDIEEAP